MFRSEPKKQAQQQEPNENLALLQAAAASVSPVNELNEANQLALARTATVSHMSRNEAMKPENAHRWLMYLVEGSVSLFQGKDEVGQLAARTPDALQPLFQNKESYQSIKCPAMATIVKFGREQLDILLREQQKNAVSVVDVHVSEFDNLIFDAIAADIQSNKLQLAALGENSARVLGAMRAQVGAPELAEVVQTDPGLTSYIMRLANRAEGAGAGDSLRTMRGAISRLGLKGAAEGIAGRLRESTLICENPIVDNRFKRYIRRSNYAGTIAFLLSKELPHLQPDEANLCAQMSDIGELAVITYANQHTDKFDSDEQLVSCIENLRGVLSSWILSAYGFPQAFIDSTLIARDWYRNHAGDIEYTDLVTAALLIIQKEMPESEQSSIPSADNLLLARRLQQAGIDIKAPAAIVQSATARMAGVQQLAKAS